MHQQLLFSFIRTPSLP